MKCPITKAEIGKKYSEDRLKGYLAVLAKYDPRSTCTCGWHKVLRLCDVQALRRRHGLSVAYVGHSAVSTSADANALKPVPKSLAIEDDSKTSLGRLRLAQSKIPSACSQWVEQMGFNVLWIAPLLFPGGDGSLTTWTEVKVRVCIYVCVCVYVCVIMCVYVYVY